MLCVNNLLKPEYDQWETFDPAVVSVREAQCGRKSFIGRQHGFLCFDHYKAQQQSVPAAPRFPHKRYIKDVIANMDDYDFVEHIARSEAALVSDLRKAGKVKTLRFGKYEPLYMQVIQ